MTVIEGNKIIAEFMGAELKQDDYGDKGYYSNTFPSWNKWQDFEALKYHSSWDWLMPVYHKIVRNELYGEDADAIILFNIMYERLADGEEINEVWDYIVQFIQWYNKESK